VNIGELLSVPVADCPSTVGGRVKNLLMDAAMRRVSGAPVWDGEHKTWDDFYKLDEIYKNVVRGTDARCLRDVTGQELCSYGGGKITSCRALHHLMSHMDEINSAPQDHDDLDLQSKIKAATSIFLLSSSRLLDQADAVRLQRDELMRLLSTETEKPGKGKRRK
jgi:hypothetical protein